ncbi:MAG: low molecular weight phosphatase family protein [Sulfuricella sp.]
MSRCSAGATNKLITARQSGQQVPCDLHEFVQGQLLGQAAGGLVAQIVESKLIEKSGNRIQLVGFAVCQVVPLRPGMNEAIDLVVTVCDNAREACLVSPRAIPAIHMPFHDPHGEELASFVRVRDEIRAKLVPEVKRRLWQS